MFNFQLDPETTDAYNRLLCQLNDLTISGPLHYDRTDLKIRIALALHTPLMADHLKKAADEIEWVLAMPEDHVKIIDDQGGRYFYDVVLNTDFNEPMIDARFQNWFLPYATKDQLRRAAWNGWPVPNVIDERVKRYQSRDDISDNDGNT